jgi:glycosyltransferase involved in cell wall biosynthesis
VADAPGEVSVSGPEVGGTSPGATPADTRRADTPRADTPRADRIAVVGVSVSRTCGVRDHAVRLVDALTDVNTLPSLHWLWRSDGSLRASRAEVGAWTRELTAELERNPPDAILLHFSIFAFSYRGLPLFVRPALSALRAARVPIITIAHELVHPWKYGGWRGKVWALTQRALLIDVVRSSASMIVTADFRADWVASRRWLPKRRVLFAPVFSNLPPPAVQSRPERARKVVGLFGYAYGGVALAQVLDAVRLLEDDGIHVQLMLLGSPGRSSSAGERWLAEARTRDLSHLLSFAGPLPPQALSDQLAASDVLLFADAVGPSSRKGTLAGSLASGRPVVAIDGRRRWSEIVQSRAAEVVQPTAHALAAAIGGLLADEARREALGARGRAFAELEMGVERTAEAVTELLADVVGGHAP